MAGSIPFNDLSRSWVTLPAAIEAVTRVVRSGWYVLGPEGEALELELAEFLGVEEAVGVASGTDALVIAMQAVGCKPGDAIATVANAGGYTTTAAFQAGLTPVFVEISADSLLMSPDALVDALNRADIRAVIVTHLYGNMASPELFRICREADVPVIEDCAQSIGAYSGGSWAGSLGDAAAFSFYPTKNLGAVGDGGAIVTSDPEIAGAARELRQYGWGSKYRIARPHGRNSRLDEVQAAVLREGLKFLPEMNSARRGVVRAYQDALRGDQLTMVTRADPTSSAHLAVVQCKEQSIRKGLMDHLASRNVATAVHYPVPDHRQPGLPRASGDLPVTEEACDTVLSLPCFPELTRSEINQVCEALADFVTGQDLPNT